MYRIRRLTALLSVVSSRALAQEDDYDQFTLHSTVIDTLFTCWSYLSTLLNFAAPVIAVGNVVILYREFRLPTAEQSLNFRRYLLVCNAVLMASYVTKYSSLLLQPFGMSGGR